MKNILVLLSLFFFCYQYSFGQNIPRANHTGPYGIQVNTYTGNLYLERNDLFLPNQGVAIELSFAYNSYRDTIDQGFGKGWTFSLGMCYEVEDSTNAIIIHRPDGRRDRYLPGGSTYKNPEGIFDELALDGNGFLLTTKYGMQYHFDESNQKLTKIEDTNGNVLTLTYDANNFPTSLSDPSGRTVDLTWENGHLKQITDPKGRTITYTYNEMGHLLKATDPMGYENQYQYDAKGLLNQMTNEKGDVVNISYINDGEVESLRSSIVNVRFSYGDEKTFVVEEGSTLQMTTYEYDEEGKLLGKTGNCCGYDTEYRYDNDNNLAGFVDANGASFQSSHDATGNVLLAQDAMGAQMQFNYSDQYNRLTRLTDKRGNSTAMDYDGAGNLSSIQQPEDITLGFEYEQNGNLSGFTDGNGNATTLSYTTNNDLAAIQYPMGEAAQFEYDEVGNMTQSTDPNSNTTFFEYDALNRVTAVRDALNNAYQFVYDEVSNLTQEIDAEGNEKGYAYDAFNRLIGVTTPSGSTAYEYDAFDNLTKIKDANGNESKFSYDDRSFLIAEQDGEGFSTTYAYDGNGNIIAERDANGNSISYTYDALNRLVSKTYLGNTDTYEYDRNGNLIRASNQNISISFQYDALNRLIRKSIDNWNKSIEYQYDKAGNRTQMIDPDNGITKYTYDRNNRLRMIEALNQTISFNYDAGGRMTEQINGNGTSVTYQYDAADRLLQLSHKKSDGSVFLSYTYTYDKNGNRTSKTDQDGNTENYQYDADNRLIEVQYTDGNVERYTYDAMGNRLSLTKNGTTNNYTYDKADRLLRTDDIQYRYDGNGNLIQKTVTGETTQYEYNGENRLIKVKLPNGDFIQYQYDPFGNRISKTDENGDLVRYLLDGDNVLQELNAAGQTLAHYTAGLELDAWLMMRRNSQLYTFHTDALGSTIALTSLSGNTDATYQYDAYGNLSNQTGTVANPYTYTGREWEAATGLYYYRTRYYDAGVGRFLRKDEFVGLLHMPLTTNRYNYVNCNPLNYTDPEGYFLQAILVGIAGDFIIQTFYNILESWNEYDCYQYEMDFFSLIPVLGWIARIAKLKRLEKLLEKTKVGGGFDISDIKAHLEGIGNATDIEIVEDILEFLDTDIIEYQLGDDCSENNSEGEQQEEKPTENEGGNDGDNGNGNPNQPPTTNPNEDLICIPVIRPIDPNEIVPPPSCGPEKWVSYQANLPYTILFENDPVFATASAQRVKITHQFDEDINPFSFRLGNFGFGDYVFEVPENISYYNNQFDFSDSLGLLLNVIAGLDIANNEAFWIFDSVDPETGLAETLGATFGFLPVNDTLIHNGEGFVNFTVQPKADSETGAEILAKAAIVFDNNPPIITNEAFNTIDADHPESQIVSVTPNAARTQYQLDWESSDIGAGLSNYQLFVATNEGAFVPVETALGDTTFTFVGFPDSTYQFFVRSEDCVGNLEPLKLSGEPSCMSLQITDLQAATNFQNNGSVVIEVLGGEGALIFNWQHDTLLNSGTATNLAPGSYLLEVIDEAGCVVRTTITIDNETTTSTQKLTHSKHLLIHKLYPVPTDEILTIEFNSPSEQVFLTINDRNGKRLLQRMLSVSVGDLNRIELPLENLAAGSYILSL